MKRSKSKPVKADVPFAAPDWNAAKSEMWNLDAIKPYPENPRTHPEAQIATLAALMKKYGPDQPIVVDEQGIILKGHGRLMAAKVAGFEYFPVAQHKGLSENDKRTIRIADNQVALLSDWDLDRLKIDISELKIANADLSLLGFSDDELGAFTNTIKTAADPELIPDPPRKSFLQIGDIICLGDHRIAVGDSTKAATWNALFKNKTASMVFTDPPYGVSYEAQSGKFAVIKGDHKRRDDLFKMLVGALREMAKHAADDAGIYIWHASSTREDFSEAMKMVGLQERQYLMWVKPSIVLGHADYSWQHEPCFYASKAERSPAFYGPRSESTVWHVQAVAAKDTAVTVGNGILVLDGKGATLFVQSKAPKNKKLRQVRITQGAKVLLSGSDRQDGTVWEVSRDSGTEHPTQKPVELARRAIENSSKAGEIVADGFLGSGTTLIASELTGRRCFGIELDPIYAEVSARRWERFTGQEATIEATGKTLTATSKQRTKGVVNAPSDTGKPIRSQRAKLAPPAPAEVA